MSPLAIRARRVEGPPVVSIRVWARGGSRIETVPGEALLAGRLLTEGSRRRGYERIHTEAEDLGWSVSSSAGYEAQGLNLDGLADEWQRGLEWAAELMLDSTFPPDRFVWLVEQARTELEGLADQPDALSEWSFRRQLYDPHPRGRPLQGTLDALAKLSAAGCRSFHEGCLSEGVIVSVAGAVDPDDVRREATRLFGPLEAGEGSSVGAPVPECTGLADDRTVDLPPIGSQAHLHLGALTIPRDHPDLVALELLGVVLGAGSGLTGRIPSRVRETEGLAYACHVSATSGAGLDRGFSHIHIATAEGRLDQARRAVLEELDRLLDAGIREREIEEARSFLLGREPFGRETARQWSAILAEAELLELPLDQPTVYRDRLAEICRADVERVARRFFSPARLKTTVAKPAS